MKKHVQLRKMYGVVTSVIPSTGKMIINGSSDTILFLQSYHDRMCHQPVYISNPTIPDLGVNYFGITYKPDIDLYDSKDVELRQAYSSDIYNVDGILSSWIGKKVILWGYISNYSFTSQLQWNRGKPVKGWKINVKKIKQTDDW